jgi:fructokinase
VLEPDGHTTAHLGGGSYNVARTLGRLGLQPVYIGRLAGDSHGCNLRAALRESGVRLDGVVPTDDPTTFARVEVDRRGVATYRFYAAGTSAPGLSAAEARRAMPPGAAALHVGGLGLVFEPQATAVATLVAEAEEGTLVMLDPNCRPIAVTDSGGYRRRVAEVLRRADVVKASEEDLAFLDPDRPPPATARALVRAGVRIVLLTHGADGATVLSGGGESRVEPVAAAVVDTIGAGDAFGAAWLAGWIHAGRGRADLGDHEAAVGAARFAARVAALTCERAGAEPPPASLLGDGWGLTTAAAGTPPTGGMS